MLYRSSIEALAVCAHHLVLRTDEWSRISRSFRDSTSTTQMIEDTIIIREYLDNDIPSIARIFCETSLLFDDDKTFQHRWAAIAQKCVDNDLGNIPSSYIAPGGNFWVATINDEVVGMVALERLSDTHGEVKRVSVDTKHHRKGIGRKLMNQLEIWAIATGIKTLSLSTGVKSKKSIAFYVSLGYELQLSNIYPTLFKDPPYFESCPTMLRDDEEHLRQRRLTLLQRVFMVLLLLICLASDYFLFQHVYLLDYKLFRHLVDSAAHGTVAFCCWGIFLLQTEKYSESEDSTCSSLGMLKKCFFNGITASLLDVDHFIAAGALSLAGATHLNGRPFGHTVTFIIVVALLVNRSSRTCQARKRRYRVCFIVVAWFSHQLRDGMRRGLWFWPLGSTPPVNYFLYLVMEESLPFVMAKWWSKAPALTEMEKLELALQKADEESEDESGEEANSGDEEEGARLLMSADAKERPSSPTSQRRRQSDVNLVV